MNGQALQRMDQWIIAKVGGVLTLLGNNQETSLCVLHEDNYQIKQISQVTYNQRIVY